MTRKIPLTIEEHRHFGRRLHEIYTDTLYISVEIAGRLGKSKSLPKHLARAVKHLSQARSWLDDVLYRADPDNFDTHVYYPGTDIPADVRGRSLGTLAKRMAASALALSTILGRIYKALPVSAPVVKQLEKAQSLLSWSEGTTRIEFGNNGG